MLRTKREIDTHVKTAFGKLSENEKKTRSLSIAKLYFKIGEYSTARQFIHNYLQYKTDAAPAYKLLAQCYEKLKKPDKAITNYLQSLNLDSKQPDIISEVANLILADDTSVQPQKIKYLLDLAESHRIQNDAVLNLKYKLLKKENVEPSQMVDMILKEIASKPTRPNLRIRLLKIFLEQNRIGDAFKYAFDLEMKNNENFSSCIDWYNMLGSVITTCKSAPERVVPRDWSFWLLAIITTEKQIYLNLNAESHMTFAQNSNLNEIKNLLLEFDQMLQTATSVVMGLCTERELAIQFLSHYRGQFCLHAASFLFLRDKILNKNQSKEVSKNAVPLLLIAFQLGIADTQESWLKHTGEATRQLILLWNRQGSFRCSQAGRTLLSCVPDVKGDVALETVLNLRSDQSIFCSVSDLLDQTRKFCSDPYWKKVIYRNLFGADETPTLLTSHFVNSKSIPEICYELPTQANLEKYEEIAQWLYPDSLKVMIYLGLGMKNLFDLQCSPFNGLNFSTQNLTNCSSSSLNQLDMESYLCAAIIQARRVLEVEKANYEQFNIGTYPTVMPFANISSKLCTEEQVEWWDAAYKISRNISVDGFGKLRMTLQHGIEAIRGVGAPKAHLYVILELGQIFSRRAQNVSKAGHKQFLESRAEALYKHGLHMIKQAERGQPDPPNYYFRYPTASSDDIAIAINSVAELAIAFLAKKYFSNSEYEECINEFSELKLPYASYFQAEAYKQLDKSSKTPRKSKKLYMDKAQECLYKTAEYLNNPNIKSDHPLRGIVENEKRRLTFDDVDVSDEGAVRNGYHGSGDEDRDGVQLTLVKKYDDLSIKLTNFESILSQISESISAIKEEMFELRNTDVFNLHSEVSEINGKISDLLNKKSSICRDDDAQVLENLLDEEFQNHAKLFGGAQAPPTPAGIPPYMLPQQPAGIPPYGSPIYNTSYPMYMYPFVNMPPQSPQQQAAALPKTVVPSLHQQSQINNWMQYQQQAAAMPSDLSGMDSRLLMTVQNQQGGFAPDNTPKIPQNSVADMLAAPYLYKEMYAYNNAPVEKSPPINVVITSSDPLPSHNTITQQQPPMSVIIPPHHIKNNTSTNPINPVANEPFNPTSQPESIAVITTQPPSVPIVQTAQTYEDEKEILSAPIKFFKLADTNWIEQCDGPVKLFKNISTGLYRLVVFRNQETTPLFNQPISSDIKMTQQKTNTRMITIVVTEKSPTVGGDQKTMNKFCFRFSLAEVATQFHDEFKKAKIETGEIKKGDGSPSVAAISTTPSKFSMAVTPTTSAPTVMGGFTFNKAPILAPAATPSTPVVAEKSKKEETAKNLFANFSFGSGTPKSGLASPFASIGVEKPEPPKTTVPASNPTPSTGFGDKFKPKTGSWDCPACYINNKADTDYCVACDTPKDDTVPKKEPKSILSASVTAGNKFTFGTPQTFTVAPASNPNPNGGFGDKFKPKSGSWDCPACYINNKSDVVYCVACDTPKDDTIPKKEAKSILPAANSTTGNKFTFGGTPGAGFSFGFGTPSTPTNNANLSTASTASSLSFGTPTSSFSLSSQTTPAKPSAAPVSNTPKFSFTPQSVTQAEPPKEAFNFEAPKSFGFVFKAKSPGKDGVAPAPVASSHQESEDEDIEEENNTHFTPAIPLPDKIEVKTGEEDEDILYSHRSKLYRFVEGEWKERGLGDVKILKHKQTKKIRIVMRREKILKICLNHVLTRDVEYKPKDEKSWLFIVADFSEGVIETMNFCLRFKTSEIAEEFRAAIDRALDGDDSPSIESVVSVKDETIADIPTTIGKLETAASEEEKKMIERLKLPADFFNYKTMADCPGCRGCRSEEFIFPVVDGKLNNDIINEQSEALPLEFSTLNFNQIPKTPVKATDPLSFTTPASQKQLPPSEDKKSNFGMGGNIFGSTTLSFGTASPAAGGNIFGKSATFSFATAPAASPDQSSSEKSSGSLFAPSKLTSVTSQPIFGSGASTFSFASAAKTLETSTNGSTLNDFSKKSEETPKSSLLSGFGAPAVKPPLVTNIFSKPSEENKSETTPTASNLFNTTTESSPLSFGGFGGLTKSTTPNENGTSASAMGESLFKIDNSLSFASLASATPVTTAFNAASSTGGFVGLSHSNDFKTFAAFRNSPGGDVNSSVNSNNEDSHVEDPQYDPHYEPIIELPEEIVVKTGEEDENKLFGERSKLFRFDTDTKEWKERGVGELKILHHPGKGTYRLLLRREQIHKLVLNHAVTADFNFTPMNTSGNAYCWATMNYSEEHPAGETERLAARFKNASVAERFQSAVNEILGVLKTRSSDLGPEDD